MENEKNIKYLVLVPGTFADDGPANGSHYDNEGNMIDFFCDNCPFWEQCERTEG